LIAKLDRVSIRAREFVDNFKLRKARVTTPDALTDWLRRSRWAESRLSYNFSSSEFPFAPIPLTKSGRSSLHELVAGH
jgi:hypothetical protein